MPLEQIEFEILKKIRFHLLGKNFPVHFGISWKNGIFSGFGAKKKINCNFSEKKLSGLKANQGWEFYFCAKFEYFVKAVGESEE